MALVCVALSYSKIVDGQAYRGYSVNEYASAAAPADLRRSLATALQIERRSGFNASIKDKWVFLFCFSNRGLLGDFKGFFLF